MRRSRRTLFRLAALALVALSVLGITVVPSPFTTATVASTPLRTLPHTDVNPLGATFFLEREVEGWKREQTVKMAKEAGIGWAKVMFTWQELEPRKGRFYDDRYRKSTWDKFDEIISLLERYGIRPIARLDKPPDWALVKPDVAGDRGTPLAQISDYADYVREVAQRYKGRIQHYQIWNEPNLAGEWGDRPPDPAGYTALLKAASDAIRDVDPDALIIAAPLAQTTERSSRALPDTDFLDSMYRLGAGPYFDILFANAYGFERTPEDPPRADVLNFQRVVLLHDTMVAYGDDKKPVWLNEFGWNAAPPSFPLNKLHWGRVTEEQQADYTINAINIARSWEWMGVMCLWYFRQVGDINPSERSDYYFRAVDVDFTPRLVYHALQKYAAANAVAMPGMHQETSSAADLRGEWSYTLDRDALGGGYAVSRHQGDTLSFQFYGTEVSLGIVRSPQGGLAQVKIDGSPPPGWFFDNSRRAVLDFNAQAKSYEVVPIATNLSQGKHTLQISVLGGQDSGGSNVTIEMFQVDQAKPSFWPFYVQVTLGLLGALGLAASFVHRPAR